MSRSRGATTGQAVCWRARFVADIEKRDNRTTAPTWRVRWRQAGLPGRQDAVFISEQEAAQFLKLLGP